MPEGRRAVLINHGRKEKKIPKDFGPSPNEPLKGEVTDPITAMSLLAQFTKTQLEGWPALHLYIRTNRRSLNRSKVDELMALGIVAFRTHQPAESQPA